MIYGYYIAHRGLHSKSLKIPENSLPAFEAASSKGYPVELDVRLTKNKKAVVFHDPCLKRMTGADLDVCSCSLNDIKALRLKETDERIPTLSEAIALIKGRVPILVEIKSDSFFDRSLEKTVVKIMSGYRGEWAVQSFNPFTVRWFCDNKPDVQRGLVVSTFKGKNRLMRLICSTRLIWQHVAKADFISCDLRSMSLSVLFKAHSAGIKVITWTARSKELLEEAAKFSSSVIFEKVEPLRDINEL